MNMSSAAVGPEIDEFKLAGLMPCGIPVRQSTQGCTKPCRTRMQTMEDPRTPTP